MWLIFSIIRLIARSNRSNGESSRGGAANAGAAIKATKTSVAILFPRERRIHPPCGSRERALLSNLEGALNIGVTGRRKSLPRICDQNHRLEVGPIQGRQITDGAAWAGSRRIP